MVDQSPADRAARLHAPKGGARPQPRIAPGRDTVSERVSPLCHACRKQDSCAFLGLVKETDGHSTDVVLTRYAPGHTLILPGRPVTGLHVVCDGFVAVATACRFGRDTVCQVVDKGGCLDLTDNILLNVAAHSITAQALSQATIMFIRFDLLLRRLENDTAFGLSLLRQACRQIQTLEDRCDRHTSHDVLSRTLHWLHQIAGPFHRPGSKQVVAPIHLNRTMLAGMIGTTVETMSRTITVLRRRRLAEHSQAGLLIYDMDRLRDALHSKVQR